MTIADKLLDLDGIKEDIRLAIVDKGVAVPEATPFRDYAAKVGDITGGGETIPAWKRSPSWPAVSITESDEKLVLLYAVWPNSNNYVGFSIDTNPDTQSVTAVMGDGTTYTQSGNITHNYSFSDADLDGSNAPVTLVAASNLVQRTAHGYDNGESLRFYNLSGSVGLSDTSTYYVINKTANDFQVATTPGGTAVDITADGTATLLPYKIAVVTITTTNPAHTIDGFNLVVKQLVPQGSTTNTSSNLLEANVSITGGGSVGMVFSDTSTATTTTTARLLKHINVLRYTSTSSFSLGLGGSATAACTATSLERVKLPACNAGFPVFNGCTSLYEFDAPLTTFGPGRAMFQDCRMLRKLNINLASNFNYSMQEMFNGCNTLEELTLNVTGTGKPTSCANMFSNCRMLKTAPMLDLSACTTTASMFSSCYALESVPEYDLSACTTTASMFSGCTSLESVPAFNLSACTTTSSMFSSCTSLKVSPPFNLSSCTTIQNMFSTCTALEFAPNLTLPTSGNIVLSGLFNACTALRFVPSYNYSQGTNLSNMFSGCSSLERVGDFTTGSDTLSNVNTLSSIFNGCTALRAIPNISLNAVTGITNSSGFNNMFAGCTYVTRNLFKGARLTHTIASGQLDATALNEYYTNLGSTTGQTLTVTGNPGTSGDDPTIATAKGWTVTGS